MRGKALGISSNNSKILPSPKKISFDKENLKSDAQSKDMTKRRSLSSPRKSSNVGVVHSKSGEKTPTKTRTVSSKTKDDADVNVEINITSNQNIQVREHLTAFKIGISSSFFRWKLKWLNVNLTKMEK